MDAVFILPRLVGVFYLLAGLAGLHAMAMDSLMDKMLAALTLKPTPRAEFIRRWMLVSGSFAVGLSGAALMVLSLWAVPLFLLAAGLQWGWLGWARRGYPVTSALEAKGRSQTTNAALIYSLMTALVVWLGLSGRLQPWLDPWALFIPLVAIALSLFAFRHLLWRPRSRAGAGFDGEDEGRVIPPAPLRVRLAPAWGGHPLRNADTNDGVIYDDYLPQELADRLYEWSRAFHGGDDEAVQEFWAEFEDAEDEAAHRAEGDSIVVGLRAVFEVAEGPVYPPDIRHVGPTETP
jgi:hypothetical protein